MFPLNTLLKHEKTFGCLVFSGGIKMEGSLEIGLWKKRNGSNVQEQLSQNGYKASFSKIFPKGACL